MALNLWCQSCGERNPERNVAKPCRKCRAKLPSRDAAVWYVNRADLDGAPIRRRAGSYLDAREMETAIDRAVRDGKLWRSENSTSTLGDLRDSYIGEPTIKAMKDYRTRGNAIHLIVRGLGERRMAMALTPQAIAEYQQARQREGVTGSSINRETVYLNGMLEFFAATGKLIPRNPIQGYRTLDENPARNRTAEASERLALSQALPEHWRPVLEVLAALPLRLSECLALSWTDKAAPHIHTAPDPARPGFWAIIIPKGVSKSGRERVVPVYYPELRETLGALPSRFKQGAVWLSPAGKPLTEHDLRRAWADARKAAGCADLRLHDLKHTAVTWLLLYGVPPHEVAHASDHASSRIQQLYANLTKHMMLTARDRYFNPKSGLIEILTADLNGVARKA